ncbi:MAG: hypothetical protein ACRDZM_19285 [Acidimicrobiia bacterium]
MVIISVLAGAIGAILTIVFDHDFLLAFRAGGTTFLAWAVARELDPDRQVSAIIAGVAGGAWALTGTPTAILPFAGLLLISRLLVETTGRRPLPTDLAVLTVIAIVISFTPLGWVMGFGLAIAIYVDDRMAEEHNRQALQAAIAAAAGSSVLVTLAGALPESMPTVRPLLASAMGVLALVAAVREPPDPLSLVDSRNKRLLRPDRLQAGRVAAGVLIFVGALVSGDGAVAVVPMGFALAITLASTEVERIERARPPI